MAAAGVGRGFFFSLNWSRCGMVKHPMILLHFLQIRDCEIRKGHWQLTDGRGIGRNGKRKRDTCWAVKFGRRVSE